jgi:hypothetical protein
MSHPNNTIEGPNPSGLCLCGCGQPTNLAPKTSAAQGYVKGQPLRYLLGHNRRKTADDYRVDPETGCWIWLRAVNNSGYGLTWRGGRPQPAHVWAWEQVNGPVPDGLEIDHVRARGCRYRTCINPDHLEAVTHAVNVQRSPTAKLTKDDADTIRSLRGTASISDIAQRFGVDRSVVSRIFSGESWRI